MGVDSLELAVYSSLDQWCPVEDAEHRIGFGLVFLGRPFALNRDFWERGRVVNDEGLFSREFGKGQRDGDACMPVWVRR
jgi:hypothetical protein